MRELPDTNAADLAVSVAALRYRIRRRPRHLLLWYIVANVMGLLVFATLLMSLPSR
jgi:hypothetical protein